MWFTTFLDVTAVLASWGWKALGNLISGEQRGESALLQRGRMVPCSWWCWTPGGWQEGRHLCSPCPTEGKINASTTQFLLQKLICLQRCVFPGDCDPPIKWKSLWVFKKTPKYRGFRQLSRNGVLVVEEKNLARLRKRNKPCIPSSK